MQCNKCTKIQNFLTMYKTVIYSNVTKDFFGFLMNHLWDKDYFDLTWKYLCNKINK